MLLVEDEAELLDLCKSMLKDMGYRVLSACTPTSAIELARNHTGDINVLVTDVVMPEMNGSELVKQLQTIHPKLKYLYMSGYTSNIIANRGVLDNDLHFIQKPFAMSDLAQKVRRVLEK